MKRLSALLILLMLLFALSACDDATPVLVGTPTPAATPTPLPDAFSAEITAEPLPTDLLGNEMQPGDHYGQYLAFGELRVYEYDDGTFLDGICVNAYPEPLDGEIRIVYYTSDEKVCGVGVLHNATGTTLLKTGTNPVYAEINTDIDVTQMDFVLEVVTPYAPAPAESPAP